MPVTVLQSGSEVTLVQAPDPGLQVGAPAPATIDLYQTGKPTITIGALAPATVEITPVPEPPPATITLVHGGPANAIIVMDFSKGPKGDPGSGGGSAGYDRINTDISGVWAATFYVQDATGAGDWIITRIDAAGTAMTATSVQYPLLTYAQAWTQRVSLTYT